MSESERTPGRSHTTATAWTVVVLLAIILYVATWPFVEIKSRVKDVGTPGVFTLPILQKPPQWVKITYRPLHALRTSFGKNNVLGQYWNWWNERLVMRPLRERTEDFRKRSEQRLRESEQRLRESQERLRQSQEQLREIQRKAKERGLDLRQRLERLERLDLPKGEAQDTRVREV